MAPATDHPSKNTHVDYHSLGPIYGPDEVTKNNQLLEMTDISNAIFQMAHNKICIPLLILTMSALSRIW